MPMASFDGEDHLISEVSVLEGQHYHIVEGIFTSAI